MALADAILRQIQTAGQPKKYVTETVQTSKEPLDVGGLGLTLALLMMGMQNKPEIQTDLGVTPTPPATGFLGGTMPTMGQAPSAFPAPQAQNFGMMDPAQLLQMIMGASGGGGGGF